MTYPTAYDMRHRRHLVRRRDALFCLDIAARWRRLAITFCEPLYLKYARDALANASRYRIESVALGFRLPGVRP